MIQNKIKAVIEIDSTLPDVEQSVILRTAANHIEDMLRDQTHYDEKYIQSDTIINEEGKCVGSWSLDLAVGTRKKRYNKEKAFAQDINEANKEHIEAFEKYLRSLAENCNDPELKKELEGDLDEWFGKNKKETN